MEAGEDDLSEELSESEDSSEQEELENRDGLTEPQ